MADAHPRPDAPGPTRNTPTYEPLPEQNGPPCAPRQPRVEDIKVIQFDVNGSDGNLVERYKRMMQRRFARAKAISPGLYYDRPITPHQNPANSKSRTVKSPDLDPYSGHSFHIIQLVNSAIGPRTIVQLLIRDHDHYIVAFRRQMDNVWSAWFRCSDQYIPNHFNAISMDVTEQHTHRSTIGGVTSTCMETMFFVFAGYPENQSKKKKLKHALIRAVVIFSEALRIGPVFEEVMRIMTADATEPSPLDDHLWELIHSWSNLSEFALHTGKNKGKMDQEYFVSYVMPRGITNFSYLIGLHNSVLMILMRNELVLLGGAIPSGLKVKARKMCRIQNLSLSRSCSSISTVFK